MNKEFDCLIIGGGASGLMCACALYYFSQCANRHLSIAVAEGTERVGNKLLLTGNGRCNITNSDISADKFSTDSFETLTKILSDFTKEDILEFLQDELGILTVCDNGLYYPYTYRSNTVLDSMRLYAEENGIEILCSYKAKSIDSANKTVSFTNGNDISFKNLVIACGGMSYPKTGSDGSGYKLVLPFISKSDFVNPMPSLVRFNIQDKDIKALKGVKAKVSVSLISDKRKREILSEEKGELLFTDNGISGICVMQLSKAYNEYVRRTGRKPFVGINFLGLIDETEAADIICANLLQFAERTVSDSLSGLIRKNILDIVLERAGVSKDKFCYELQKSDIDSIIKSVTCFELNISGTDGFEDAQVTSGGISLKCLGENLRLQDNIFLIGEIVNVDGLCGGFNLTWAFSSAMKAAGIIAGIFHGKN